MWFVVWWTFVLFLAVLVKKPKTTVNIESVSLKLPENDQIGTKLQIAGSIPYSCQCQFSFELSYTHGNPELIETLLVVL